MFHFVLKENNTIGSVILSWSILGRIKLCQIFFNFLSIVQQMSRKINRLLQEHSILLSISIYVALVFIFKYSYTIYSYFQTAIRIWVSIQWKLRVHVCIQEQELAFVSIESRNWPLCLSRTCVVSVVCFGLEISLRKTYLCPKILVSTSDPHN